MLMRRFTFSMAPDAPPVAMTTGATIHTTTGLYTTMQPRVHSDAAGGAQAQAQAAQQEQQQGVTAAAPTPAAAAAAARDVREVVAMAFTEPPAPPAAQ